jgi:hypothetical protein
VAKGMDLNYFREKYPKRSISEKAVVFGYKVVCALGLDKHLV